MWEQLSYDDPDLSDVFFLKDKVKLKLPKISDKYFRVEAEKLFLSNPRSFGSMAGWYNGGSDMFVDQLVSIINSKKLKNKIKMYVRIIGKLILSWRRAMERTFEFQIQEVKINFLKMNLVIMIISHIMKIQKKQFKVIIKNYIFLKKKK